jgi:hypothetical protein
LSGNGLTGTVPDTLFRSSSLQRMYLNDNWLLTGNIPDNLGVMTNLEQIHLGGTQMQGELPSSLFTLPKLTELSLPNASFGGTLSEDFAYLNQTIRTIDLSDNDFSGPILTSFDALTNLGKSGHDAMFGACVGMSMSKIAM